MGRKINAERVGANDPANEGRPVNILIADDHPLMRRILREILADRHAEYHFSEADRLEAVNAQLAVQGADLLLIDLSMPGMCGAASLKALREAYPDIKIAVVTSDEQRAEIIDCLAAGVHGYILKSSPAEDILHAVRTVLAGGVYVTPKLADLSIAVAAAIDRVPTVIDPGEVDALRPEIHLTRQQTAVLRLLREGRATKDIARRLELSLGTVNFHLAAIYRTLNVRSRAEAIIVAMKIDLTHTPAGEV